MQILGRYKVPPVAEELLAFDVFWEKESDLSHIPDYDPQLQVFP